ncbi:MAG: type II toxin-antitoxin system RelB/DinJ family antitoxin [Clostridiales bacterium]|nr:type II toxin-antitoxin system RelB/DinJ family antitoxin [Clostridiales bacterium]
MAQTTMTVRLDEALKKQFGALCNDFGMSVSTAVVVFAKAVVRERKIPFDISAGDGQIKPDEDVVQPEVTDVNGRLPEFIARMGSGRWIIVKTWEEMDAVGKKSKNIVFCRRRY